MEVVTTHLNCPCCGGSGSSGSGSGSFKLTICCPGVPIPTTVYATFGGSMSVFGTISLTGPPDTPTWSRDGLPGNVCQHPGGTGHGAADLGCEDFSPDTIWDFHINGATDTPSVEDFSLDIIGNNITFHQWDLISCSPFLLSGSGTVMGSIGMNPCLGTATVVISDTPP